MFDVLPPLQSGLFEKPIATGHSSRILDRLTAQSAATGEPQTAGMPQSNKFYDSKTL